jgi:hypothetical protein
VTIPKTIHPHSAVLEYDAAAELLKGKIGAADFREIAYSGGSRGHKKTSSDKAKRYLQASSVDASSRLATTREVYDKKTDTYQQRGGTIPPGNYRCVYVENHPSFGKCIFLDPASNAHAISSPFAWRPIVHHRGGFYIHGHGPKGSDGCLVLANEVRRNELNIAVRDFTHDSQGRVRRNVFLNVTHVSYMLPAELGPSQPTIAT